jgi:glycosyltransferase involved in cell wall biosynthesis
MTANAKFSIVICTYNDGKYLTKAITSVLQQSYPHWELIVVDDGSKDETYRILSTFINDPKVHTLHNNSNIGKAACLNRVLKLVESEWIMELDADDWLPSDSLEKINNAILELEEEVDFIYGNYVEWRERSRDGKKFLSGVKSHIRSVQGSTISGC